MQVMNHSLGEFVTAPSIVVSQKKMVIITPQGWRDTEHVCQLKCATGPLSGHSERSDKHACERWSGCSRNQVDLRTNVQMP